MCYLIHKTISRELKTVFLFIFMLFDYLHIAGQGILNTEKYEQNAARAFSLAATFGYEGARGNTNLNKTDLEMFSEYHFRHHIFRLVGGFNFLNSGGERITSNIYSQIRYNYVFTERLQSFMFYQLQNNEILLIRRRELAGAGIRISLLNADSAKIRVDAGIGGMYENELLNEKSSEIPAGTANHYFRMTDFLSARYSSGKIKIVDVLYYQPLMRQFSDFRLYNDLTLQFAIQKHLSFGAGMTYRYDSRPPGSLKRYDIGIKNSIILSF